MRLIDADRLLTERMKSKYYHLPNGDTAIPLIDIEHAPTVGTGSWIPRERGMIAIKTTLKTMPEYCDDCQWYECRPHPHKGWTEGCGLMMQCMDDDQPKEWIYDGNGRPEACPLFKVEGSEE